MTTRNEALPSNYINVDLIKSLPGAFHRCVVQNGGFDNIESPSGKTERKFVLYFSGLEQGLVVNATNWDLLEELTGEGNSEAWVNFPVELYVDPTVRFGNKTVEGVRVRALEEGAQIPQPEAEELPF